MDNTKHEGDLYTTEQKEFENYDLVEVPSNASGTMAVSYTHLDVYKRQIHYRGKRI